MITQQKHEPDAHYRARLVEVDKMRGRRLNLVLRDHGLTEAARAIVAMAAAHPQSEAS